MDSIMLNISADDCKLIAERKKILVIQKTIPKTELPIRCYIFCSQTNKIIGEFICQKIDKYILILDENGDNYATKDFLYYPHEDACMNTEKIVDYGEGKPLYGLHISNLTIYESPKVLNDFLLPKSKFEPNEVDSSNLCIDCQFADKKSNSGCSLSGCKYRRILLPPASWMYVDSINERKV